MALVDHSPDTIRLSELSNDGESFLYSRTEGNLNEILSDCLGNNPYDIRLTIQPIGDAYEVRGKIQTTMDL
ncbi:MAG: hypothetical protein CL675_13080, partial [Bdellovibrionaceae bacterium]|nr:hypothetical protein [Pseudobdellovibrionaceae bacterium]